MAIHLYPSSYQCDCGHVSHFAENTVREMQADRHVESARLADSERDEHQIEFVLGNAEAVICPRLGRCKIKGWA